MNPIVLAAVFCLAIAVCFVVGLASTAARPLARIAIWIFGVLAGMHLGLGFGLHAVQATPTNNSAVAAAVLFTFIILGAIAGAMVARFFASLVSVLE